MRGADLIIDALFGAGLDRPIVGEAGAADRRGQCERRADPRDRSAERHRRPLGAVLGAAIQATETVTFFRLKPGHLLLPGRMKAGLVTVVDIGIPSSTIDQIRPRAFHNVPPLWLAALPRPRLDGHKYARGHAVVVSGPMIHTGAARLAARAALRIGAGLVTVASPPDALAVNAGHLTAIMLAAHGRARPASSEILADKRRNAVVLGPALGRWRGDGSARRNGARLGGGRRHRRRRI